MCVFTVEDLARAMETTKCMMTDDRCKSQAEPLKRVA
jgi:hypothetical protein